MARIATEAGSVTLVLLRSLARRHHPDHGGEPARFQEIRAAFETLRRSGRLTDRPAALSRPASVNRYQLWMRELDAAAALTPELLLSAQPLRRSAQPPRTKQPSDSARRFAEVFERELAAAS